MRLGALGPGKVAVEVHDDRLHLTILTVRPHETDERAGMGDDIAFVSSQLADQEEFFHTVHSNHVGLCKYLQLVLNFLICGFLNRL